MARLEFSIDYRQEFNNRIKSEKILGFDLIQS